MSPTKKLPAVVCLKGMKLDNGWTVEELIAHSDDHTGGYSSVSYIVRRDGEEGFLKAFDFSIAFGAKDSLRTLTAMLQSYLYELDLLTFCNNKKLRKVVLAIDNGEVQVPGYDPRAGTVNYIIFELADGDMRGQVSEKGRVDTVECLLAIKDVATGMFQIHRQMIAHQDCKPSNVLRFGNEHRLGDFGCASQKGKPAVHDEKKVAGDRTYAPPELLYGQADSDFVVRRVGCDLFMLGSLAAFMLTGINVKSEIFARMDTLHHPNKWNSKYVDVLPYVLRSYAEVMADVQRNIDPVAGDEIGRIIAELCHPDPKRRGNSKRLGRQDQYSLERYISRLDVLHKQARFRARTPRKTG
jgi:eukaryotic-like serine/threonine-protein kinase